MRADHYDYDSEPCTLLRHHGRDYVGFGVYRRVLWSMLTSPIRLLDLVLRSKPAVWVGKRSYGLYLWHYPLLLALNPSASTGVRRSEADLVVVLLSFVATIASSRFVEEPFLRLKTRFQHAELNEPDRSAAGIGRVGIRGQFGEAGVSIEGHQHRA
jgi:peptidoglycan/LPS O-acetylase OafA/YrhL